MEGTLERDPATGVQNASVAAEVFVRPPELARSRQGTPFPREARVEVVHNRDTYAPVEARELALRLNTAADAAERADELLLARLQEHCAALHHFLEQEDTA